MRQHLCAVLVGFALCGQTVSGPAGPTRARLLAAEARGAAQDGDLQLLLDAATSPSAALRCQAVRALGRLERPELAGRFAALLTAPDASVRAEAANALAQSVGSDPEAASLARAALLERLGVERRSLAVAAAAEALGRLPLAGAEDRQAAEDALVEVSRGAAPDALEGVLRGFESLARGGARLGRLSPPARDRLSLVFSPSEGGAASPARLRRLALMALNASGGPDRSTLAGALRDPDEQVRRLAVAAPTAEEADISTALADPSAMVRYEALRALDRRFKGTRTCEAATARARDDTGHVALLAIDSLAACPEPAAIDLLAREAEAATPARWHRAAHAIVSLAAVAPDRARPLVLRASRGVPWQARMYAARAAAHLRDEDTLRRLAADPHPNVREAAVTGLSATVAHQADALYLAALESADNQLVMTAAAALQGTPDAGRAVPRLFAALERFTATRSDTSRDPRAALLERLKELASASSADRLRPLLADFDARIARLASDVWAAWTGRRVEPSVPALPAAEPVDEALLARLEGATLRVLVAGLGSFEARLLPGEAPLACLRVARLASNGYYDGLTFHRVVPNFVIQGGSPGANEFAGHDRYMRDEVGSVSQRRGTLGISTRGRHTGDAQIYVNLVDSPRLDHDYTVFAEVVGGMDVVDLVLEGAVITRVELQRGGVAR